MAESKRKLAKVSRVLGEWKRGALRNSSGAKVESHDQAVAIALSEAGLSNQKDMGGGAAPAMSASNATTGGSFVPPPSFAGGSNEKPYHWTPRQFNRRKLKRIAEVKTMPAEKVEDLLHKAGEELARHENPSPMPGYGQIFLNDNDEGGQEARVWYVGGDGDEDGFGKVVEEKIKEAFPGCRHITYEAESFPPKNEPGWKQVYPKQKPWSHTKTDAVGLLRNQPALTPAEKKSWHSWRTASYHFGKAWHHQPRIPAGSSWKGWDGSKHPRQPARHGQRSIVDEVRSNKSLWDQLTTRRENRFYLWETKDFGPNFALDLAFSGKPQYSDEDFSITFPFAASRGRDRVGDFLEVGGIDTTNHRKNPVAYVDHGKQPGEYSQPIGKCEDPQGNYTVKIYPEQGVAIATVYLDRESRVAQEVFRKFKTGILRVGSIGYRPLNTPKELRPDPETGTPKGRFLDKVELLEATITGLPANGDMASLPSWESKSWRCETKGWVTLSSKDKEGDKHGSTHVYIDNAGSISKGPAHMVGKKVGDLKDHKVTATHGETHPDEKKSGKNPQSPLDNKSPTGDNKGGGETQPKKEDPKMNAAMSPQEVFAATKERVKELEAQSMARIHSVSDLPDVSEKQADYYHSLLSQKLNSPSPRDDVIDARAAAEWLMAQSLPKPTSKQEVSKQIDALKLGSLKDYARQNPEWFAPLQKKFNDVAGPKGDLLAQKLRDRVESLNDVDIRAARASNRAYEELVLRPVFGL